MKDERAEIDKKCESREKKAGNRQQRAETRIKIAERQPWGG
jgi:hypothetical protein